jgi:transcriptional regulator GlxA family with amidase domain
MLRLTARTLRRRLVEEGASFAELVELERYARATLLLRCRELSLEEVAGRLGYGSARSFARAFHRWSGTTPLAARGGG